MKTQIIETHYRVDLIHEYDHCQYYTGHGDIFDTDLIECLPVAIPFSYWVNDEGLTGIVHETMGKLKQRIMQGLNSLDFSEYPFCAEMPDSIFRVAVDETLGDNKFNGMSLATLFNLETNPNACYDEFMHYCYFHIYQEEILSEVSKITLEQNR